MRYAYLAVEGPQDVELVGRLLKPHRFKRVRLFGELDASWHGLIPRTYPPNGELNRPVPVPVFFTSDEVSAAVQATGSDSQLVPSIEATLAVLRTPLDAVGALLDADSSQSPEERFRSVRSGLVQLGLSVPEQPGNVSTASPRCGVFVLPDNQTAGTLEDLLLECAGLQYPELLKEAQAYVGRIQPDDASFSREDMKEFRKPAGSQKATVACISSVLKPGRTLQVSLQDNRWLEGAALDLPRVSRVRQFLKGLLGLT